MKTDASCGDTSAAGSWSEPTRGWASSAGCWFVMNICSPSIVPFSTSPVSGLHSGGIYETRSTHVITYPQGDETVSNFFDIFETQRQIYQGPADTGTLLKTVLHCYNDNFSNCATPNSIIPPITDKYSYNIFPSGRSDAHVSYFDTNGRLTEADDYDFVMGGFGAPTRKNVIAYATHLGRL